MHERFREIARARLAIREDRVRVRLPLHAESRVERAFRERARFVAASTLGLERRLDLERLGVFGRDDLHATHEGLDLGVARPGPCDLGSLEEQGDVARVTLERAPSELAGVHEISALTVAPHEPCQGVRRKRPRRCAPARERRLDLQRALDEGRQALRRDCEVDVLPLDERQRTHADHAPLPIEERAS